MATLQKPVRIIYAPYWILKVLNRENVNLSQILRYDVIKTKLSREDIFSFIGFHQYCSKHFGGKGFIKEEDGLLNLWMQSLPSDNVVDRNELIGLDKQIQSLYSDSDSIESLSITRLQPTVGAGYDGYYCSTFGDSTFPYNIHSVGTDMVLLEGLSWFDLAKIQTNLINYATLVRRLLKALYVYHKHEQVSSLPIFNVYLQILNQEVTQ